MPITDPISNAQWFDAGDPVDQYGNNIYGVPITDPNIIGIDCGTGCGTGTSFSTITTSSALNICGSPSIGTNPSIWSTSSSLMIGGFFKPTSCTYETFDVPLSDEITMVFTNVRIRKEGNDEKLYSVGEVTIKIGTDEYTKKANAFEQLAGMSMSGINTIQTQYPCGTTMVGSSTLPVAATPYPTQITTVSPNTQYTIGVATPYPTQITTVSPNTQYTSLNDTILTQSIDEENPNDLKLFLTIEQLATSPTPSHRILAKYLLRTV